MESRYHRQEILSEIGTEGQERLRRSSALIIGLGGLGAPVATYLTGAGVGRIGLADPDTVSLTNLQRQVLYTEAEIGLSKVEQAAARLKGINSEVSFTLHPEGITRENSLQLVSQYDVVVDCCDNFATRYLIDDACAKAGRPWVHGTIGEFHGQASVFNHRLGRRYIELYPDREELCSLPRKVAGVLGAVPGVVGAIQACEAIKILANFGETLEGKLFTIDLTTLQTNLLNY